MQNLSSHSVLLGEGKEEKKKKNGNYFLNLVFQLFQLVIAAQAENQNLRFIPASFPTSHFLVFWCCCTFCSAINVNLFWWSTNLLSMLENELVFKTQQIEFREKEKPTQDILSKSEIRLQACITLLMNSKIGTVLIWLLQYIKCFLLISMSWLKYGATVWQGQRLLSNGF